MIQKGQQAVVRAGSIIIQGRGCRYLVQVVPQIRCRLEVVTQARGQTKQEGDREGKDSREAGGQAWAFGSQLEGNSLVTWTSVNSTQVLL